MLHELGLCEGVLQAVERRAAGRRVTRVRVRVGAQHRVVLGAALVGLVAVLRKSVPDLARYFKIRQM